MSLPISTPIIKPVNGLCNLSCSYCYASDAKNYSKKNRMDLKTLKSTIDFFCEDNDDIEFIWHGGEPLLAGLNFYHEAVKFQNKWLEHGKNIVNFLQTNATLINNEWVNFLAENNFIIGVSLDGPENFHNKTRCYPNYRGSYHDVMKGIDLLRKAEIFNGIICGITEKNYKYPNEIFNFFISENIKKLKFARIRNIGYYKNIDNLIITSEKYYDFLIKIFDLWLKLDDPEIEIRDIQSVINLILGGNKRECIYMGKCDQFVTIYSDGSIYGCDSFTKINSMFFGNVSDKISDVKTCHNLKIFQETLIKHKEYCKKCNWNFICNGGCAKDCYLHLNSAEPLNDICANLKRYFGHISDKLKFYDLL